MASLGLGVSRLGINRLSQVGDGPPQPRWVQAAGRRHQDRLGPGGHRGGQVVGAGGQHRGMGG
jgi:hypothetical protein